MKASGGGAFEEGGMDRIAGRSICGGSAEGPVLYTDRPIGFFGLLDRETGVITDPGHPLRGRSVAGTILVFPYGKGSTVGSYAIYAMSRNGCAPAGMVMSLCEAVVAAGAVMAGIPAIDQVDVGRLRNASTARLEGGEVWFD